MNRRVLYGRLGGQAKLNAYIRSLSPAAWFMKGVGQTVTGSGVSMWADQADSDNSLVLPRVTGNNATIPDAAYLPNGDIDVRIKANLTNWTGGGGSDVFVGQWAAGGNRSFLFYVTGSKLTLQYSTDGSTGVGPIQSSTTFSVTNNTTKWVRFTQDVDNGAAGNDVRFYTSDDGISWTEIGTAVTTAGAITRKNSAATVMFGQNGELSQPLGGRLYRVVIYSDLTETTKCVDIDFSAQAKGTTSFTESSSNAATVTVNQSGALPAHIGSQKDLLQGTDAARPALQGDGTILFNGTSHYLKTAAFTLNQPTCVVMAVKQVSWTSSDYLFDGNTNALMACLQQTSSPRLGLNAGTSLGTNTDLAVGSVGIVAATFNGASSALRVNNGTPLSGNAGTNNAGGFTIGAAGLGAAAFSNIQAYEVLILPVAPSTAQLDRIISGLMARHGVA